MGHAQTHYSDAPNHHCLAYYRVVDGNRCLCIVDFSKHELEMGAHYSSILGGSIALDLVTSDTIDCGHTLALGACQLAWLFSLVADA